MAPKCVAKFTNQSNCYPLPFLPVALRAVLFHVAHQRVIQLIISREKTLGKDFHTSFALHEHIHLTSELQHAADHVQFGLGHVTLVLVEACVHSIFSLFHHEIQCAEDRGNSPGSSVPADFVCRATFERKSDVILVRGVTAIGSPGRCNDIRSES